MLFLCVFYNRCIYGQLLVYPHINVTLFAYLVEISPRHIRMGKVFLWRVDSQKPYITAFGILRKSHPTLFVLVHFASTHPSSLISSSLSLTYCFACYSM